ncbi:MAG TPA: YraN family protein [Rhizomicrobium sp.]|nr:YraN family protein [Rhizomicrobium sp.]
MTAERFLLLKRAAERRGRRGELLAMLMLVLKGYRILGRRIRTHAGEIDMVARTRGGIVCFVEVKTRNSPREAQEAVLPRQAARISRAAELFMAQRPWLMANGVRYDTIVVSARSWPRHLRDAWRPRSR